MLRDRYASQDRFALVPSAGLAFDPVLAQLDALLDDDDLYQRVRADLAKRRPQTATRGRHAPPVEVILRRLVVKRLYGWSDAEVEQFVADSLVLRQCCRVYLRPVPDDTTRIRWANLIGPDTVAARNDRAVALAQAARVTRGRTLRSDGTVVETSIRYPTDSTTRGDGVRVLSRLLRRAKGVLGDAAGRGQAACRTRTRRVRRLTQRLHRVARRTGEQAAADRKQAYATLIGIAQASRRQATRVAAALRDRAADQGQRLAERVDHILPLVDHAIAQATRRVLRGEAVPADEKLLSLFAPHTQAIRRHTPGKLTAFGRTVLLDEVEGGIVSHCAILDEVGLAHPHCIASRDAHQERCGHPPDLVAGDRGRSSPENADRARERGVRRGVLPKTGRASGARQQHERQRWFRRGCRFRAGAEGRMHVLKRDYGLARCRDHGEAGFGRWVGWGIRTHNLAQIATTQAARATRPAPPARRVA
jgi:IS5 family transposase